MQMFKVLGFYRGLFAWGKVGSGTSFEGLLGVQA